MFTPLRPVQRRHSRQCTRRRTSQRASLSLSGSLYADRRCLRRAKLALVVWPIALFSLSLHAHNRPGWWNGRHEGLKIPWPLRSCGFESRSGHTLPDVFASESVLFFREHRAHAHGVCAETDQKIQNPRFCSPVRSEVRNFVHSAKCRLSLHRSQPLTRNSPWSKKHRVLLLFRLAPSASDSKLGVNPPVIFLGGRRGSIF